MKLITTTIQGENPITRESVPHWIKDRDDLEQQVVNIYPQITFQRFDGFGGAVTQASAWVLMQMPADVRARILDRCFGPDGLSYSWCRVPIDSCDFSTGHYCADDDPADEDLVKFSLAHDEREILPILREAQRRNPDLKLMLSPWSPPAYMKTNQDRNHGGKLLPQYRQRWARYLCRYIQAYQDLGFPVAALSVQNEPNACQTWDSCMYSPKEELSFVRDVLGPALHEAGLGDVTLLIWDHNKERLFERTETICSDTGANAYVGGCAFHWYTGDHFEALNLVERLYPGKKLFYTEGCVEYSRYAKDQAANARMYAHDIIGNLNGGVHVSLDWNIVLDHSGGPNHVGNFCDAPVMCHIAEGTAEERLTFKYLEHFSKYIHPEAVRIGFTRYTDQLEMTAFRNPDDTYAVILYVPGRSELPVTLRFGGQALMLTLPGESISTLIW